MTAFPRLVAWLSLGTDSLPRPGKQGDWSVGGQDRGMGVVELACMNVA